MTSPELIAKKIALLLEFVARARRRRPAEVSQLDDDDDLQDALGMAVLVAIQEAIDLAFHVATTEHWGVPSSYAESFELLAKHEVIEKSEAQTLVLAVGLRNRLAHGYAAVEPARLWAELPAGLDALESFARALARFAADAAD